jgi:hypothetical protein
MIFGNPSEFAIQIDLVPEWSSRNFQEGLFCVYLNWHRLSSACANSITLKIAVRQILSSLEDVKNSLPKPAPLPELLKGKSEKEIFDSLYELTYPPNIDDESVDNCWNYVVSPDAMSDIGFSLFLFGNEETETVLGGSCKNNIATSKTLPIGSILSVVKKADEYVSKL